MLTFLTVVAFLLCAANLAALVYACLPPTGGPTPLPRPEPLPTYEGRHRAVLIGGIS